jgi:hypothetical protein
MPITVNYNMMILMVEIIFGSMACACLCYMSKRFITYCCDTETAVTVYLEETYPHREQDRHTSPEPV